VAVAFDAVGPAGGGGQLGAGVSSLTWTHVIAAGATDITIDFSTSTSTPTVSSVKVGSTSCTLVAKADVNGSGSDGEVYKYRLASPPTGSQTITVTMSAASDMEAGSKSYTGGGSLGTPVTAHNPTGTAQNSVQVTVSTTSASSIVDMNAAAGSAFNASATTGTARWVGDQNPNSAAGNGCGVTAPGTAGSVTPAITLQGGSTDFWGAVAVEILPSGGGAAPAMPSAGARRAAYRAPAVPPTRRFRQLLPVPAQLNPPYGFTEITQRRQAAPRPLSRRGHVTFAVPPQLNPPFPFAEQAQRRQWPRALSRRGRQAAHVPAQAHPVTGLRQQQRPRGLLPRRGHGLTPVPAQQSAAPNPAITFQQPKHLRMLFQRRGRVAMPVPAQQSAPANPALAFQPLRHPRLLLPRRGRGPVHVPGQQDAGPRQRQARPARLLLPRRSRLAQPLPPQAPAIAPAWVTSHRAPLRALALIRRRFGQLMPWPQATQPAFSVGTLTASDAPGSALAASDAAATTLTATTSTTGGPS